MLVIPCGSLALSLGLSWPMRNRGRPSSCGPPWSLLESLVRTCGVHSKMDCFTNTSMTTMPGSAVGPIQSSLGVGLVPWSLRIQAAIPPWVLPPSGLMKASQPLPRPGSKPLTLSPLGQSSLPSSWVWTFPENPRSFSSHSWNHTHTQTASPALPPTPQSTQAGLRNRRAGCPLWGGSREH